MPHHYYGGWIVSDSNGRIPDIYEQLGRLSGLVEGVSDQIKEMSTRIRTLNCATHEERMAQLTARLDKLDGQRQLRPPSAASSPVSQTDLSRYREDTERVVLARVDDELQHSLKREVTDGVVAELNRRRDEENRAAAERREQARREQEEKASRLAAELATKQAADDARWARVRWVAGIVVALLGSSTAAGWCGLSSRMDSDRVALTKAIKAVPPPVVVRVQAPASQPERK